MKAHILTALVSYFATVSALTIAEINGPAFLSPYDGTTVTNIKGLVTAVSSAGFYLRDPVAPSAKHGKKPSGSTSIYVFGAAVAKSVAVGDIITLGSAVVDEYRSDSTYIPLTELTNPKGLVVVSSGNKVDTIALGKKGLQPPTTEYSALDVGGAFGVPGGQSLLSTANPTLAPEKYGLDFWESLNGELVSISVPVALGLSNNYGDVWVRGDWKVTGLNKAGGLTITQGRNGADANPEAITIGSPIDGTRNPNVKMGDQLEAIEGVVTYAFGFYRILPTTAFKIKSTRKEIAPPTSLTSKGSCKGVTIGQYNIENLTPESEHLPSIAAHIANYMRTPDLLFLQEVQDNDGITNDGVTSGNETLETLAASVYANSGVKYAYTEIAPVDGQDGGAPGGNIRVAYFYNTAVLTLVPGKAGGSTDPVTAIPGPGLSVNPGRIDPLNAAWTSSRKPLVAAFSVKGTNKPLFAINVHLTSKGGSTSIMGDSRPPLNGGVENRAAQTEAMAIFVKSLLAQDKNANIISAGDFNEFAGVVPMERFENLMWEVDEIAGIKEEERYTYNFDMNSQQLDHMLVSKALKKGVKDYQHLHVNTWAPAEVSDHDPSVGLFDVC